MFDETRSPGSMTCPPELRQPGATFSRADGRARERAISGVKTSRHGTITCNWFSIQTRIDVCDSGTQSLQILPLFDALEQLLRFFLEKTVQKMTVVWRTHAVLRPHSVDRQPSRSSKVPYQSPNCYSSF